MALAMRQVEHVLVVAHRFVFLVLEPHVGPTVQSDTIPGESPLAVSSSCCSLRVHTNLCVGFRRLVVPSFLTFVLTLAFALVFAFAFALTVLALVCLSNFFCLLRRARYSS